MRKKIALFIGNDITAHLIMNEVVTAMMDKLNLEPILYLPETPHSNKADLPELKEYSFFERTLLNETVYPFIEEKSFAGAKNLSPHQLAEKYSLQIEHVKDVNDPAFVTSLHRNGEDLIGGISIRCFQIFKPPIINVMKQRGPFLNLHPGLLPEYRGVMSTMRRMFDISSGNADSSDYGLTLHKIDKGIDTGKILDISSIVLDPLQSGFMANINLASIGSKCIIGKLEQMQDRYTLRGYPQENGAAKYFTYPTAEELKDWNDAGIVLFNRPEVVETLVDKFSKAGTQHGEALTEKIVDAIEEWDQNNNDRVKRLAGAPANDQKNPLGPGPAAAFR